MTADTDPPLFQMLTEIGIIQQLSHTALERRLPDGLKVSQFSVLNHLVRLGGDWPPARLAAAFQVTKGAMTNTVQRLESRGLIEVLPDPSDGRGKLVRLTEAGREMRGRCISAAGPALAAMAAEIPEEEVIAALPVLKKLRIYLDQHRD